MFTLGMRYWGIAVCLVIVFQTTAYAEIYKYKDEHGNIHFTDRPPTEKRTDKNVINPSDKKKTKGNSYDPHSNKNSKSAKGDSFYSVKKVSARRPIKNPSEQINRSVDLAKVYLDMEQKKDGRVIVGREYMGTSCSRVVRYVYANSEKRQIEPSASRAVFNDLLSENGYSVFERSDSVFSEEKQNAAELVLAALIKDITFNLCKSSRFSHQKAHTLVHLKVEWQLFDPLEREVVYKHTTEGSDDGKYVLAGEFTDFAARQAAFKNALKNLLSEEEFVNILQKKAPVVNKNKISSAKAIQIQFMQGNDTGDFVSQSNELQQGVVTIRSLVGHGTGFLISKDGYILTNAHVVQSAERVAVILDKKTLKADVVRTDFNRDVALLRLIVPVEVKPVPIGSDNMNLGESIYIIGTPIDESLSHTVTRGVLSATRVIQDGRSFYQTDASINPGNSGGPAFNSKGEVIGIAVSGLVNDQGSTLNINFLIPIKDALEKLSIKSDF